MWDDEEEDWIKLEDQSGDSEAVRQRANEMTEITVALEEGELIGWPETRNSSDGG